MLTFADMEGGESFDASFLGSAEEVVEERVADDQMLLIRGLKTSKSVRHHITWLPSRWKRG